MKTTFDVFALRESLVAEYKNFATSFTKIYAQDIKEQVDEIYAKQTYWPEPLLQLNPNYKKGATVSELVQEGSLHPTCERIFRTEKFPAGESRSLWIHQQEAIFLAIDEKSFVVTTGTGSGKSLCFFIPIVSAILKQKDVDKKKRTRAIIIYPMNALANSQQEEIAKYIDNAGPVAPISVARYTGQEDQAERERIAANPPDIMLTNFMMLELLMTRQDDLDRQVMANCEGLQFLVLDELHTYRGRQGADVAMLVRRVRERLAPDKLQCIGTSATMASEGSAEDKNTVVANVASKLFATGLNASQVIAETLESATGFDRQHGVSAPALSDVINRGVIATASDEELKNCPLAAWVETTLGITRSEIDNGKWIRAVPKTLEEAVALLAKDSGVDLTICKKVLRDFLLVASTPEIDRTANPHANKRGFFAFKLHQFISGAGHAYATLEAPGARTVTIDGQQFLPSAPDKRLYPIHFCRACGHEYHPVKRVDLDGIQTFLPRGIDDAPPAKADDDDVSEIADTSAPGQELFGFLTPHDTSSDFEFTGGDDDYPDSWYETNKRGEEKLKSNYRKARAQDVDVAPDGAEGHGLRAWFIPGQFRFCLRCRDVVSSTGKDRNRLASLSAEGRSSATTVLVGSVLRWMHSDASGLAVHTRKLLGFTDNRQDAALQAGHFNDFIFVGLLRAGFLKALAAAGQTGLRAEELGAAQQRALGFDSSRPERRQEWLENAELKGFALQEAESTLRKVLEFRVWYDQRRGWRYTHPNLEQVQVLEVNYLGLNELVHDDQLFVEVPLLRDASPQVRRDVFHLLLTHMRGEMAIRSGVLDRESIDALVEKSKDLRAPWNLRKDEPRDIVKWLVLGTVVKRRGNRNDEMLVMRSGVTSRLGKALNNAELWGPDSNFKRLNKKEFLPLIECLLETATDHGLVVKEATPFGDEVTGYKLNANCVHFVYRPHGETPIAPAANAYFLDLYNNLAQMLDAPQSPLFGFESREHTAQVEGDTREFRENRFRFGTKEQKLLSLPSDAHNGENPRFLPVLFCSPTMELGVDISELNAVYMRNVPPTPANYAQRSGRGGRSGQAALVVTYCSAQGPHDQYFFRDPRKMVHGTVRPPMLDLANQDLVSSHLHAVWLASTRQPLASSIAELLELPEAQRPVKTDLQATMTQPDVAQRAIERMTGVLQLLKSELSGDLAPWYPNAEVYAREVATAAFDNFNAAFRRWRDLYSAAEQQRDHARRIVDDHAAARKDKDAAQKRQNEAVDQIKFLEEGDSKSRSDFSTYRYLATEGFLPGYNFPRLPLMAYIPSDTKGRQAYLQRPRFLALSEFGPRSLVYHEGRAYRVIRALLVSDNRAQAADANLKTKNVRICRHCGAAHFDESYSNCHACNRSLGDCEIVGNLFRIENVGTKQVERITANDEERVRQGFELQTTFEWALRDGNVDQRKGVAEDNEGPVLELTYGPSATITRINKGLRRRADRTKFGFLIDPRSGYWAKSDEESGDVDRDSPDANARQLIVPYVADQKNAMLVRFPTLAEDDPDQNKVVATLQYALLRGIEKEFELEQGEMLAEPLPSRNERNGFLLYEAAEGGAGVLNRLVGEANCLASVAAAAIETLHFTLSTTNDATGSPLPAQQALLHDTAGDRCAAACYSCLLSYYNQPEHELLDRRNEVVQNLLVRLMNSATTVTQGPIARNPRARRSQPPPFADALYMSLLDCLTERGFPNPDQQPLHVAGATLNVVWREHYVVATFEPLAPQVLLTLESQAFVVLNFGVDTVNWHEPLAELDAMFGRTSTEPTP